MGNCGFRAPDFATSCFHGEGMRPWAGRKRRCDGKFGLIFKPGRFELLQHRTADRSSQSAWPSRPAISANSSENALVWWQMV